MEELICKQIGQMCRTCMRRNRENESDFQLYSIYNFVESYQRRRMQICDLLNSTVPKLHKIEISDSLPTNICAICLDKLIAYDEFQNCCIDSELKLRNVLQIDHTNNNLKQNSIYPLQCIMETTTIVKQEIEKEEEFIEIYKQQEIEENSNVNPEGIVKIEPLLDIVNLDAIKKGDSQAENGILNDPLNTSMEQNVWRCESCSLSFLCKSNLTSHFNSKTCRENWKEIGTKFFKCEFCEGAFTEKNNLTRHLLKIHNKDARTRLRGPNKLKSKLSSDVEGKKELQFQRKILRQTSHIFDLPDNKFEKIFRLNKAAFEYVLQAIEPKMKKRVRSNSISNTIKLAATLRFLAQGSYQLSVGNDIQLGLAQPTVSTILEETLNALQDVLCPVWIKLTMSESEKNQAKMAFYHKTGFPGVVGCVDGTHIKILAPNKDEQSVYCNRKGYFSLNAMVICDHKTRIRFIDARHAGSAQDSHIWNISLAKRSFRERYDAGERNSWLLGDAGYPLEPYLMTPYSSAQEGSPEAIFNSKHSKTKNIIERTVGIFKSRFRCLLGARQLHYTPSKATKIANVCAALHNICLEYGTFMHSEGIDNENTENEENVEIAYEIENTANNEAAEIREQLKTSFC